MLTDLDRIGETHVLKTILGGKVVYNATASQR